MKTLIIFLLMAATATSQTRISLTQDVRLASIGDDKGNDPLTANFTIRGTQFIDKGRFISPIFALDYEYADLAETAYNRFGFGVGFNLQDQFRVISQIEK